MNLTLFFRLVLMSIFQEQITYNKENYGKEKMSYDNQLFYCPRIVAKDSWSVSLQIHNGNYCSSNNGYRMLGHTIENVEWGMSSIHESLLNDSAEDKNDTTSTVGSISIQEIEKIFENHGGIDWEATISISKFEQFTTGRR